MSRRQKTPEGYVLGAVLDLLAAERVWARRMNSGAHVVAATESTARRFVRFGSKGMADVLATPWIADAGEYGTGGSHPAVLWIETKDRKGKQREAQEEFQREVEEAGHFYLLARSSDDVLGWLHSHR